MKRIFFSILVVHLVFAVQAKKVDLPLAQKVGIAYYYEHAGQFVNLDNKNLEVTNVFTESNGNIPLFYIINLNPKGYVIVSADDNINPVIGYSYESNLDPSKMPEGLKYWMSEVRNEIVRAINENILADENISSLWNYYSTTTSENLSIKKSKAIEPLITSTWNQDNYYNQFCPAATGGPDGKAYAGCVATAMSQVMYYWRYPITGNGSHGGINFGTTTYLWDNMLDDLTNYNEAAATLIYHCGIAVDMEYAADGSSASCIDAASALKSHFRYNTNCEYKLKGFTSTANWATLLKAELDAKHPMIYSGSDGISGGHAWNCDGYDASNNFHMNWGWSGYANGYFALTNLSAGGSSFNSNQGIVRYIYPATGYPYSCSGTKSITGVTGTIEDGSGPSDYTNNKDCLWLIDPAETVTKITLSFINFATEASNDVVTVYDGNTTAATVLGTFSGSTLPTNVSSTGPQMLVRFVTNGSATSTGWKATYKSTFPTYCSGVATLTDPTGTIDDGSGADNYSYNHTCRWRITPPGAASITLYFTAFNLTTGDYLKIYDQTTNTLIHEFSGTTIPSNETYNTGNLLLFFRSDGYLNSQGFDVNYTSSAQLGLEENGNISAMSIFPNPASSELNIQLTISETENITIELCSITGVVVYKEEQNNFSGNYNKTINTSGLSQGVYLLRIKGDKQSLCKKVIIE